MNSVSYQTVSVNKATASKEWVIVDADGQSLGRLCSKVAKLLRGKYKPSFTPHVDCGDNVIIINAKSRVVPRLARDSNSASVNLYSLFPFVVFFDLRSNQSDAVWRPREKYLSLFKEKLPTRKSILLLLA